jgi:hypothetical protein
MDLPARSKGFLYRLISFTARFDSKPRVGKIMAFALGP